MEVCLLGTGSADGWPSAWCPHPCCATLTPEQFRTPSSALVDGRLLIDPGPEAARQALRAGRSLAAVTDVLVSHAHHDHLDAAFLLYRSWSNHTPLRVIGPRPVVEECRRWLDPPEGPITFLEVTAGDAVAVGAYRVRALPATHRALGEACLYVISDGQASVLWGTDTGPLSPGVRPLLPDAALDLVLLDETFGDRPSPDGHHDLASFADTVSLLRSWGAVGPATDVRAIHLSHFNPPPAELERRLARIGARTASDLAVLRVPEAATT